MACINPCFVRNKQDSTGAGYITVHKNASGGMLHQKTFENLLAVLAVLVLFEKFSGKFCSKNFLTLILSA